ncbi:MAG TPA: hypothetical protein VF138_12680 [Caulobacteraceae bacterium]
MIKHSTPGRKDMLADAKPSSRRPKAATAKIEAKPVKGVVDYKALARDIMAKFPKTIAHLAK